MNESLESIGLTHVPFDQHPLWTTLADDLVVQLDVDPVPWPPPSESAPAPAPAPGSLTFDPASRRLSIACRSGAVIVKRVKRQGGKGWIEAKEWWAGNKGRFSK